MAKLVHFFFLALFSNALLYSQIVTSISTSDAGQLQLNISNNSNKTITAYIWSREETPAGSGSAVSSEHQFDTVGSHLKPVLAGESRVAGVSSDPKATLALVAAIFEDGSTFGSADGVQKILHHRAAVLAALKSMLPILQKSPDTDFTTDAVQKQLADARDALAAKMSEPVLAGAVKGEYIALFGNLKREAKMYPDLQDRLRYQQALIKATQEHQEALEQSKPPLNP
jgi:hypothetical protein